MFYLAWPSLLNSASLMQALRDDRSTHNLHLNLMAGITDVELYNCLGTTSKRALARQKKRFGYPYQYRPRYQLVERLTRELRTTEEDVIKRLFDLRAELLNQG